MAINERLVHTASAAAAGGAGTGNQEEGLVLHLDANDVDSYDGDGSIWYDIKDHEYTPATNVDEHFNTVLYTGDGTSSISVTGAGFQPDLIIQKNRDASSSFNWYDSVRGATKLLYSSGNAAELTYSGITSFDSDGFTNGSSENANGNDYAAWCFKAGGAPTASNPIMVDGIEYATLSAAGLSDSTNTNYSNLELSLNTKLGFSIVKATAPINPATARIPHGLGVEPEMVIQKATDMTYDWNVWHSGLTNKNYDIHLNKTDAQDQYSNSNGGRWTGVNSTDVMYLQDSASRDQIYYSFISKRGVSKVGSYEGNASSTGVKVYTGFEPAFILFKPADTTTNWTIHDNQRGVDKQLIPDSNTFEVSGWSAHLEFHRDGFKVKGNSSALNPASTMIYLAFAKNTKETELATTSSEVWSGFQNAVTSITSDSTHPSVAPGVADTATTSSIFDTLSEFGMADNGNTEANNEIFITLNTAKSIRGFAVYEKFASTYKYTGTTKLYGSYDNSSWNLLGSTVQTTSIDKNRNETTFAATPEYQYYKFTLSANTRTTYEIAWAFELIADLDITPSLHLDPASYSGTGTTWTADAGSDATVVASTYDEELGNSFDITSDTISLSSGAGPLDGTTFSFETWLWQDSNSGTQYFFSNTGISFFTISGTQMRFIKDLSGTNNDTLYFNPTSNGSGWATNKWNHVVVTFSSYTAKIYINGVLVHTEVEGSGTGIAIANYQISPSVGRWKGKIGQYRVYNSALSEEAIRKNLNFTKNDYPNGNNATGNNMDSSDWNSGGYFDFDGSSEYFTTGDLGIRSSALTMSAWVNLDTYSTRAIMMLGSQAGNAGKAILFRTQDSGKLAFYDGSAVYTTSNVVLTLNTWHHVALAVNGTSYEFFVDGNSEGSATALEYSGDDTLDIGYYGLGNSQHWDGFIGSIKIYNKTLTSGEILADYNATESTY